MRPAAFLGSVTGHPGAVSSGSANVLVNGKPAAAAGIHKVECAQHAGSAIASGREDVLVNGRPMARLLDKVFCTGAPAGGAGAGGGGPVAPSISIDGMQLTDAEKAELVEALKRGDQLKVAELMAKGQLRGMADGESAVAKVKVVVPDRADPNAYDEYEVSGPEAKVHSSPLGPQLPKVERHQGGVRIRHAASAGAAQIKKTKVVRIAHPDGSVTEVRASASGGVGVGGGYDIVIGPGGVSISIDTPAVGFGGEVKKMPAPLRMPAIDLIVANTSFDVFLGA